LTAAATLTRTCVPDAADDDDDGAAWVTDAMLGLPCGARRLPPAYAAAVGYSPAPAGQAWLVVATIGQHLPLPYPDGDIGVLTPGICPDLGLCAACLGMGDLAWFPPLPADDPVDHAAFLARGFEDFTSPCPLCAGSGRPALRIIQAKRRGHHVSCQVRPLMHRYVPPLPGTGPPALPGGPPDRWCLACGQTGTQRLNCQAL
jgi:hypothetical protein